MWLVLLKSYLKNNKLLMMIFCSASLSFHSSSFEVLGFTFSSFIYFELPFYRMRQESSLIFLRMHIQFYQSHLLRRLSFLQCVCVCVWSVSRVSLLQRCGFISGTCIWLHWRVWLMSAQYCLITLVMHCVLRPGIITSSTLLKIRLAIWGLSWSRTNFRVAFF